MINDNRYGGSKIRIITRRMFVLSSLKLVVFFGLISRLFYLQVSENIKYKSLSDKNRLKEWKISPKRGLILDFYGEKIADNTQVFQLHMVPEDVDNLDELFFRLSKLITLNERKKKNLYKKIKARKPWETIIISDNLTWSEFSKLNLFLHEIHGIKPVISVARKYPADGSLSHLVGYVSSVSQSDLEENEFLRKVNIPGLKIGKTGLEKSLNKEIIGKAGYQRYEVNAFGKRVKEIKFIKETTGKDFKTTIDMEVQQFAGELLKNKTGSICVMDIYTGDIIAMVSSPTFDANKFVHGISVKDWEDLINNPNKPLVNKSIAGLYPPGSTIKPIVALSALENDIVSPKTTVECTGEIELYGRKYHCWKKKGHGFTRLRDAIKKSCDVYFYEAARRLGVDRIAITAKQFGLGQKNLNFLSEEKAGIVPSTKWKLKNIGKGWVIGETLLSGIGQGYFQTTPLQLCLMTAQLANGGCKIAPRIIYDEESEKKLIFDWKEEFAYRKQKKNSLNKLEGQQDTGLPIKTGSNLIKLCRNPENIKFVLEAQFGATNEPGGTSYYSRYNDSKYIFAGKTGTSQTRTISPEERALELKQIELPYAKRDHALFTAFAPYKNPRYALSILIEHGGTGSGTAAPIAKKLIKKIIDRHDKRKNYQTDFFRTT